MQLIVCHGLCLIFFLQILAKKIGDTFYTPVCKLLSEKYGIIVKYDNNAVYTLKIIAVKLCDILR